MEANGEVGWPPEYVELITRILSNKVIILLMESRVITCSEYGGDKIETIKVGVFFFFS